MPADPRRGEGPRLAGRQARLGQALRDIRAVERHLARNGTALRKFFRQVSTGEQHRFLKRLNMPDRLWPLDLADLRTRNRWGDYMRAYEDAIHDAAGDTEPGPVRARR